MRTCLIAPSSILHLTQRQRISSKIAVSWNVEREKSMVLIVTWMDVCSIYATKYYTNTVSNEAQKLCQSESLRNVTLNWLRYASYCIVLFVFRWIVRCRMAKHSTSITKIWRTALQFNNHSETSNSRRMCHRSVQSHLYWYTHAQAHIHTRLSRCIRCFFFASSCVFSSSIDPQTITK